MNFIVIGKIFNIQVIARGRSIKEFKRLNNVYGKGKWRKLKGIAKIRLENGSVELAEVHWYESHGIGKKEMKIKNII